MLSPRFRCDQGAERATSVGLQMGPGEPSLDHFTWFSQWGTGAPLPDAPCMPCFGCGLCITLKAVQPVMLEG